jgi:ketosteroid isomerase-like protein
LLLCRLIAMSASTAREVFARQIECIERDDRVAQMELYTEDVVYEFPFANDRPRRIEGRDEFRRVMEPLWAAARARGIEVRCASTSLIDGADPNVLVAEFAFEVVGSGRRIEFVQVLRIRDGRIAQLREYFSPVVRAEMK